MPLTIPVTREYVGLQAELIAACQSRRAKWNAECSAIGVPPTAKFVVFPDEAQGRLNLAQNRVWKAERAMGEYLAKLQRQDIESSL